MPTHPRKKKKKLPASFEPIKKGAKLTEDQKKQLEAHKKHHTNKHMASMRMNMLKGMSFEEAHKKVMSKVGK